MDKRGSENKQKGTIDAVIALYLRFHSFLFILSEHCGYVWISAMFSTHKLSTIFKLLWITRYSVDNEKVIISQLVENWRIDALICSEHIMLVSLRWWINQWFRAPTSTIPTENIGENYTHNPVENVGITIGITLWISTSSGEETAWRGYPQGYSEGIKELFNGFAHEKDINLLTLQRKGKVWKT